jgi:hypothetical protein
MKRLLRYVFYSAAALLWFAAIGVGLEFYARWEWRDIEKNNPFVVAALGQGSAPGWPDLDSGDNEVPVIPDLSLEPAPPPVPPSFSDADDHLGSRLAALNEEDRNTYASLRDLFVVVYDQSGQFVTAYGTNEAAQAVGVPHAEIEGKPLADSPLAAVEGLDAVQRAIERGTPEMVAFQLERPGWQATIEMSCYPMRMAPDKAPMAACSLRNISGLPLTEVQARAQQSDGHPMWKEGFVEYRKYARISPEWWTNNLGFRDEDVTLPKPPGLFRIACVGGSTTEEGFTNGTTYPNQLEKKLRESYPNASIELVNCGVTGLDSLGEKRRALDFALLEPDLVIEYNAVNDICHALLPMWEQEAERSWPRWRLALRKSEFLRRYCNGIFWPDDEVIRTQMRRTTMHHLRVMQDVLRRRGIELAICSFACPDIDSLRPEERDYYEWNTRMYWQGRYFIYGTYCRLVGLYNEEVKALCQELGLLYIPLAENIKGGAELFGDICHMRPKGIERKVEVLKEQLGPYLDTRLAKN